MSTSGAPTCPSCSVPLANPEAWKSHSEETGCQLQCEQCQNLTFGSLASWEQHQAAHSVLGRSFRCEQCPFTAGDNQAFEQHQQKAHQEQAKEQKKQLVIPIYSCSTCQKLFASSKLKVLHVREAHKRNKKKLEVAAAITAAPQQPEQEQITEDQSGSISGEGSTLSDERVPDKDIDRVEASDPDKGLKPHNKPTRKQGPAKGSKVKLRKAPGSGIPIKLEPEEKPQPEPKPYPCEHCTSSFNKPEELQEHQVSKNISPIWPIPCAYCPSQKIFFCMNIQLRQHLRSFHRDDILIFSQPGSKQAVYQCKDCDKLFSRPSLLNNHKLIHKDGRLSFKCSVCGRMFMQRCKLDMHLGQQGCQLDPLDIEDDDSDQDPDLGMIPEPSPIRTCKLCHTIHNSEAEYERHMESHKVTLAAISTSYAQAGISEVKSEIEDSTEDTAASYDLLTTVTFKEETMDSF